MGATLYTPGPLPAVWRPAGARTGVNSHKTLSYVQTHQRPLRDLSLRFAFSPSVLLVPHHLPSVPLSFLASPVPWLLWTFLHQPVGRVGLMSPVRINLSSAHWILSFCVLQSQVLCPDWVHSFSLTRVLSPPSSPPHTHICIHLFSPDQFAKPYSYIYIYVPWV